MTWRPGKKTGPKPRITRGDIVDAVLEIGLDKFTLTDVAAKLGVSPSALYRHVESRDDIIGLVLARVARGLSTDVTAATWQDLLRDYGRTFWDTCEHYPGLSRVLIGFPGAPVVARKVLANYLKRLQEFGLGRQRAIFALDFIGDTVLIVHQGVSAMREVREDGRSGLQQARDFYGDQPEDALMRPADTWIECGSIFAKIDLIIRGLEVLPDEFFEDTGL